MQTSFHGRLAAALAVSLSLAGAANAQDILVDTGPGNTSTIGSLSMFNDGEFYQFVGMRIELFEEQTIGRIDAWLSGFGDVQVKLYSNSITGFPETELESETFTMGTFPVGWQTFAGMEWTYGPGMYWVVFEVEEGGGSASFPSGVPFPLDKYVFYSDGNNAWASLGRSFKLGLRVWTPAPVEPVLVPGQFATIQDAIDFVSDGQVIEVAPGTYNEAINFGGKSITVRSSDGAGATTIDATGKNQPAVRVPSGSNSSTRLEGFTITGGVHTTGLAWGGGLSADGGDITVEDCVFTGNTAESGCGAAAIGGAEVTFTNCVFDDNDTALSFSSGGGVYVNDATATFDGCTFMNNDVASSGGAMNVNSNANVTATDCAFAGNTAGNAGGGVVVISSTAQANFTNCTFDGNTAVQAGGAMVNGANASFANCTFTDNSATFAGSTSGGGLQAQGAAIVSITGCDFVSNNAFLGAGAQFISFSGTATINASRFRFNTASNTAGGVQLNGSGLTISNTEFCANSPNHTLGSYIDGGGNTFSATCIPDNDDPSEPAVIEPNAGGVTGTFEGATNSGSSSCDPDGVDLFYAFTITNGPVDILIDTCGSSADTALAVFDADDVEIACATDCDTACSGAAACIALAGLENGEYLIRLSLESGAVAGAMPLDFVLNINEVTLAVPGDLNNDAVVDEDDAALFCAALGSSMGDGNYIAAADFDDSGAIDHLDQQQFNQLYAGCGGDVVTSGTFAPPADGVVDAADLAYLLGAWGNQPSCADTVSSGTFAPPPDGKVDAADLAYLLGAWGPCN